MKYNYFCYFTAGENELQPELHRAHLEEQKYETPKWWVPAQTRWNFLFHVCDSSSRGQIKSLTIISHWQLLTCELHTSSPQHAGCSSPLSRDALGVLLGGRSRTFPDHQLRQQTKLLRLFHIFKNKSSLSRKLLISDAIFNWYLIFSSLYCPLWRFWESYVIFLLQL